MDAAYYHQQFVIEHSHWWYVGRRKLLSKLLNRYTRAASPKTLEIGCGGGGNLPILAQLGGPVMAMEMEPEAVLAASKRQIGSVWQGKLEDDLPPCRQQHHVVGMFDVLEHIEDDAAALQTVRKLLTRDGRLFLTVPAYPFLWTRHDEVAHHFRRYTRRRLLKLLRQNGFRVVYASYFNTWLFPVAMLTLLVSRLLKLDPEGAIKQPASGINALLARIFSSESRLIPHIRLPFGLSIAVVAERQDAGA